MSQSQISERMFEFHCWIHGTFHRGDKNGRIEGRLCVRNYVSFENISGYQITKIWLFFIQGVAI